METHREEPARQPQFRGGTQGLWGQVKTFFIFPFLFLYMFVVSGLILCFLMLLTYIFVWPFNRLLYRRIVLNLSYLNWCQFTFVCTWWSGSELTFYISDLDDVKYFGKEHSLVVSNHKYEMEWIMCWLLAERYALLGNTKVFGKSVLRFVPLIGWMWCFCESIFLRREWEKDKRTIMQDLQYLNEYPEGYFVTLLLYAEGTRFTPEKHAKSMEFARSRGMPELKHHLLPRTKGFTLTMQGIRDKVPAIYDFTTAFLEDAAAPTLKNIIKGRKTKAQIFMRRIPIENVPMETEAATDEWLHQLFREKDKNFDDFYRNGKFTIGHEVKMPMRYKDLLVTLFWFVTLCIPLLVFMFNAFVSGSWMLKLGMVALLLAGYIALKLFMGVTEIKKASAYGMDKNANSKKGQ